jgi:hypothetical protein
MTTDDEYARRLQQRYAAPDIEIDPDVIVRRGRRRRTGAWTTAGLALVAVGVGVGLMLGGLPRPLGPGPADAPPPEPPDAEAALVISPATAHPGDVVAVSILNRGQGALVGGLGVSAERWDGRAWRTIGRAVLCTVPSSECQGGIGPSTGNDIMPDIGFIAPAPGSSVPGATYPFGMSTTGLEPGWYRLTMAVTDAVSADAQRSLTAAGQFQVVAPSVASPTAKPSTAGPKPTDTPGSGASPTPSSEASATIPAGFVITDALFGRAGQAFVTLDGATLLTTDAGGHWTSLTVPGRRIGGRWLDVHGSTIAAATLDATGTLTYERSGDAGKTWTSQRLPLPMPDGGDVDVSLDAGGTTVAVAATLPHNSGIAGIGALFVGSAGHDLVARPAPTWGAAAWVGGHLLFVGGVESSQLFVSDDLGATWTQSTVDGVKVTTDLAVPGGVPTIGFPVSTAAGRAVIPVTLVNGDTSSIDLLATTDGRTFTSLAQIPTGGTFSQGATASGTSAGPDRAIFADSSLVTVTGSDVATVTPQGLPGPVFSLTFSDATHGLAWDTVTTCPGKVNCSTTGGLYASSDGGRTWTATQPSVG